jgi:2-amino-4-hydroxy-6-hydroxymethyldihydropteridine diphosphokinase
VERVSSVWQSPPLGDSGQADYLNAAIILETHHSAFELKERVLAAVECSLGRVRSADRYAPRTIDIDIILYDHDCFRMGKRSIPDPELLVRPFIAIPMAEIAPDFIHPLTGESLLHIAAGFVPEQLGMLLRKDLQLET